jgi:hypothetical protein
MAIIMAKEITTTDIGVPTTTALVAIVLAAIGFSAVWIII